MRVLVAGATGYLGSRLVPVLLRRGHEVVAAASSPPEPDLFGWTGDVDLVQTDATDPAQALSATEGVDAVCYLLPALSEPDLPERDRAAARVMRDAVATNGVTRVVHLSELLPEALPEEVSPHLASRLEVEEILGDGPAVTLTIRAGVVIGAGSTSFEMLRQSCSALLVQPVPTWMRSRVQPIAVADVVRVLADAVEGDATGSVDIGGPDVVTYPELLAMYAEVAHLSRLQVPVHGALPLREAMEQALMADGSSGRLSGRRSRDPAWVRTSWLQRAVTGTRLPGSVLLGSSLHIAEHRVRGLLALLG